MATVKKTKSVAKVNTQRRSQLEYFGKAAAAIAGMSLLPSLTSGAVNFRKASGTQALYLADSGQVCIGTTTPYDGTTKLTVAGDIRATASGKVYGAVWNDFADYLEVDNKVEIEFGKVYVRTKKGETRTSLHPCEKGIIGIASDTFGMSVGKKGKGKKEIPIAVAGIVLAYCDREYESGTPLTSGRNGIVTKMYWWELIFKPHCLVATFYKPESQKKWNGVTVNNRHWVKVK
jgi:hypothetical protein